MRKYMSRVDIQTIDPVENELEIVLSVIKVLHDVINHAKSSCNVMISKYNAYVSNQIYT